MPEAITLISDAIDRGAKWFVRSDLKKFFQTIPKPCVETFLRENIQDELFINLFMSALTTELSNEDEVRDLIHLFPIGEVGVPQGSALSALCANIVLSDFDAELNGHGIYTVRYLDDFVILGPKKGGVLKAWDQAQTILDSLGMACHDPRGKTGKAAMGEVANGFEFLSFHIDDKQIYPSKAVRGDFLEDLRETIRSAKKAIATVQNEPRRAEPRFIQSLNLLDRKIRGWGDAFSPTTTRVIFAQLDRNIDKLVNDYLRWFGKFRRNRPASHQRRIMGIALLIDTDGRMKNSCEENMRSS